MSLFLGKKWAGKLQIKNIAELTAKNFTLGVVRGYYYGEEFKKLSEKDDFKNILSVVTVDEHNFKQLGRGRIDGLLSDPFVGATFINKLKLNDSVHLSDINVVNDPIYVMLSKKLLTPEHLKKFNSALSALKADGTHKKILERYLSQK